MKKERVNRQGKVCARGGGGRLMDEYKNGTWEVFTPTLSVCGGDSGWRLRPSQSLRLAYSCCLVIH